MAEQTYKGYGLPDTRPLGTAHPTSAIAEAIKAAREVLSQTLLAIDFAPYQAAPFRSQYFVDSRRTVLNIDAAVSVPVNAAGVAIAAAESVFQPLNPTIQTTIGADLLQFFPLWSITPVDGSVVVIESWGVTCVNAPPEALAVRIRGGSIGGLAGPPNPTASDNQYVNHQRTKYVLKPNVEFAVDIGNVTNLTALFVEFSVAYYRFSVTRFVDRKEDMKLTPGFGVVGCDSKPAPWCAQ